MGVANNDSYAPRSVYRLYKAIIVVNALIIFIMLSLAISLHSMGKRQLNELGAFTFDSFKMSWSSFWPNDKFDAPQMRNFIQTLINADLMTNFFIYDESGNVVFRYILPERWQVILPPNDGTILRNKNLLLYDRYDMVEQIPGYDNLTMCIVIDASGVSQTAFLRNFSIVIALIMQGVLLLFYKRLKYMINTYNSFRRKLNFAQQEAISGRFASILAHEIKNPLSSIRGLVNYSILKSDVAVVKESLDRAISEVDRLTGIVNGFLQFGKPVTLELKPVSIQAVLDRAIQLLAHDINSRSMNITIDMDSDFTVVADENQLMQVFFNLILNAVQASPPENLIYIYYDSVKKIFSVENENRKPYDPNIEKKLFEPFNTTKVHGSGLGLAVSKKLIEIQGFDIFIESVSPYFIITIDFKSHEDS